ncbi:hypothetical protein M413DRAFT_10084 [Hebeloma cylindrosporum]|uniref:Hydrophobin n=1 Tax=Hebeloma cylindrosporum TaxID=76867 RepID=A0A0C3C0V4_HEBCY|nr:hypothetical protein M413DRAFT_10084 [Hebeloma cylindrosporum h7]
MRFITITTVAASLAMAIAMPASDNVNINYARGATTTSARLCNGNTASNALCCGTGVIGILSLDCATPTSLPKNIPDFKKICSSYGQQAQCCLLAVAGQGILCSNPV